MIDPRRNCNTSSKAVIIIMLSNVLHCRDRCLYGDSLHRHPGSVLYWRSSFGLHCEVILAIGRRGADVFELKVRSDMRDGVGMRNECLNGIAVHPRKPVIPAHAGVSSICNICHGKGLPVGILRYDANNQAVYFGRTPIGAYRVTSNRRSS